MNIIQFCVEIERTKSRKTVAQQVVELLTKSSGDPENYVAYSKRNWESQKPNLRSLYVAEDLVAHRNKAAINYFVFDNSSAGISDSSQKTFAVLAMSEADNIDYIYDVITTDLANKLKPLKMKVLKEENILLYPYNADLGDIYIPDRIVKAVFRKSEIWETPQKWRFFIILIISILLAVWHFFYEKYDGASDSLSGILISIYISGFFFCLTDGIVALFSKKTHIGIEKLSESYLINPIPVPYSEGTESQLKTPEE